MVEHLRVFLDANVLAAPVPRTLLLAAARLSGYSFIWSQHAEDEASRHMRPAATSVATLRTVYLDQMPVSPSADVAGRFLATQRSDRQILADAKEAGTHFLVTNNVNDFAVTDLRQTRISAVTPDLFMPQRMTTTAYEYALNLIACSQKHPPTTVEELHRKLAQNHPRLFAAQNKVYNLDPIASPHHLPEVEFRGTRCIQCGTLNSSELPLGLDPKCAGGAAASSPEP